MKKKLFASVLDGYGKISTVYDSISGTKSAVLYGWDNHPTVELDWDGAYDVSFSYALND